MGERDRFGALITAAGASRRMGRPKALVEWRGVPLLRHQIGTLQALSGIGDIVVVLGGDAAEVRRVCASWPELAGVRLVDNERWEQGRSTSLEVGARAFGRSPGAGVLIVAVDQPLEPEVVTALRAAWAPDDEVVVPVHGGRRGHPILVASALLPELERASAHPMGLRDIVHAARVKEVAVASAAIHLDLNTPEDLARAQSV